MRKRSNMRVKDRVEPPVVAVPDAREVGMVEHAVALIAGDGVVVDTPAMAPVSQSGLSTTKSHSTSSSW